jgi:hypothetical protein
MPSMAFVADQSPGAKVIHNNQRSEMVALTLPAGNYALFASGTVEGSDLRSVHCFIETTTTTVAIGGAKLEVKPVFVPVPALFGVLALPAADTVRVNCLVSEFTPGDAAGVGFRLMAISVEAIG